ncbi:mRNA-decapping enzyme subunit 2 [Coemansia aciculifera]|uniref:mRNA-decapping enzyme subunit 2 n=1 Tax=Coemansia aciculifera TaxID=417176 RepID=A0A9W8M7A1_9FUNG|nr:mRNA-decapping enzyme subunit 2 [Coemansia aciculifera]KAJ2874561.1 mRNA-decapping enzyme subunit 2 [Coemansia aciculifera]
MFEYATFAEVLDDLASRFIINVPEEELQEIERICFQIEQAHWFYDDFVREANPSLPSMSLKTFAARMFKHCPLLSQWAHNAEAAYQTFLDYKFKVPVCGAIILNEGLDKVLLVKGWSSRASWGFPRGKINKDEPEWLCAQREVIEETGFDILPYLVEKHKIEIMQADQKIMLYIITGIAEDTQFIPTTRKEISQISWHYLDDLPCSGARNGAAATEAAGTKAGNDKEHRYYLIKPFVKRIKTWAAKHPERLGRPAVIVNRVNAPLDSRDASGPVPLVGSGPLSMKELFKTVSSSKSPVGGSSANTPNGHQTRADESGSASLLQTLLLGNASNSGSNGSSVESSNGNGDDVVGGDSKLQALSNLMRQAGIASTPPPALASTSISTSISTVAANVSGGFAAPPPPPVASQLNNGTRQSPLKGFMFDTRAIMSAYTNSAGSG